MDTCIAIRTMAFKDGIAYLQAGGGIVFDSVEEDEYIETLNKLKGNMRALETAERTCSELTPYYSLLNASCRILVRHSECEECADMMRLKDIMYITIYAMLLVPRWSPSCAFCLLLLIDSNTFTTSHTKQSCNEFCCPCALIIRRDGVHDDSRVHIRVDDSDGRYVLESAFSDGMDIGNGVEEDNEVRNDLFVTSDLGAKHMYSVRQSTG